MLVMNLEKAKKKSIAQFKPYIGNKYGGSDPGAVMPLGDSKVLMGF